MTGVSAGTDWWHFKSLHHWCAWPLKVTRTTKKRKEILVFILDLKLRNKESTKCLKICWKKTNESSRMSNYIMRYRLYISLHNKARSVRSGTTPLMSYLSPMWPSSCLHGCWSVGHSAFQQATSCEIWLGCRNTVACIERLTRADCLSVGIHQLHTLTERGTVYGTHLEHRVGYNLWNTCE